MVIAVQQVTSGKSCIHGDHHPSPGCRKATHERVHPVPVAVRGQSTAVNANCLGSTCTRSFLFSPHSLNSDPPQRLTKALGSQHSFQRILTEISSQLLNLLWTLGTKGCWWAENLRQIIQK